MRVLRSVVLAVAAALGVGVGGAAWAQSTNTVTVRLPSGGLAEIRYVGNVPPEVVFLPSAAAYDRMPAASVFGRESPFAVFERISAEIDRHAAAMFRYAAAVAAQTRDGQSYTYAATIPTGGCKQMQAVWITQIGGAAPRVERYSAGDCGMDSGPGETVRVPAGPAPPARAPELLYTQRPGPAAPVKRPDLILTQGTGAAAYTGMITQAAAR
jgi:hypothetical protein